MQSSNPVLTRPINPPVTTNPAIVTSDQDRGITTVDGVAGRTLMLIAVTVVAAAISWNTLRAPGWVTLAMIGSTLAGLVLALVITFKLITNPLVINGYAVLQGVFLGIVSRPRLAGLGRGLSVRAYHPAHRAGRIGHGDAAQARLRGRSPPA